MPSERKGADALTDPIRQALVSALEYIVGMRSDAAAVKSEIKAALELLETGPRGPRDPTTQGT